MGSVMVIGGKSEIVEQVSNPARFYFVQLALMVLEKTSLYLHQGLRYIAEQLRLNRLGPTKKTGP